MEFELGRRHVLRTLAAATMAWGVGWRARPDSPDAAPYPPPPDGRIPGGYDGVDPRTAKRITLSQPLTISNPIFPGDPPFTWRTWTTIAESGYLLEQITSLGTHTGTHVSAPAHFVERGRLLSELDESWTLMPLVTLDLRERIRAHGANFQVSVDDLHRFERRHGPIPAGGCVLLHTGLSRFFTGDRRPGRNNDYFDPVPGLSGTAVAWLYVRRHVVAVGADTFGPDATSDEDFSATATALQHGGITVENVGPRLREMRPFGDWVAINGARPRFSGFQVGITGYTIH